MVQRGNLALYRAVPYIIFNFTSIYQIHYIAFSAAKFRLYLYN